MKNLRPVYIVLGGSVIVALATLVTLLVARIFHTIDTVVILLTPLLTGLFVYVTFHFFIKAFITERLKILYRSIRKGKFSGNSQETVKMTSDVIHNAEIETKKWTEARIAEISQLREKEEFRKEFLGNLAHELKTPVFAIQGYILTLLEGGLEDETVNRKFLERASTATDRMTAILEDLDTITKLEVNQLTLDYSIFDVKLLTSEIMAELNQLTTAKRMSVRFSKNYDPIFVYADRNKIGQVLTNLISNSIFYGDVGGTTFIRFYELDGIVTIEVSDNGPGIPEEDIPRLFERFYRVEKSRNRHEGGSGLGLAIVKHFIEAHDQTISVRSTLGVGSTFTFSLDTCKPKK